MDEKNRHDTEELPFSYLPMRGDDELTFSEIPEEVLEETGKAGGDERFGFGTALGVLRASASGSSSSDFMQRIFLFLMLVVFPIIIGGERYLSVTAYRLTAYSYIYAFSALFICGTLIMQWTGGTNKTAELRRAMLVSGAAALSGLNLLLSFSASEGSGTVLIAVAMICVIVVTLLALSLVSAAENRDIIYYLRLLLTAYAVWLMVTSFTALNLQTAIIGLRPRCNGAVIQLTYITLFMLITVLRPDVRFAASAAVGGGTAFSFVCLLHYVGWDVLNVGKVVGAKYATTFFDHDTKFLGTMGNVNLGSYVICVMCVLSAACYLADLRFKKSVFVPALFLSGLILVFENAGFLGAAGTVMLMIGLVVLLLVIMLLMRLGRDEEVEGPDDCPDEVNLVCFSLMLFIELNMKTDAGYVSLALSALAMLVLFFVRLDRLRPMLNLLGTACLTVAADKLVFDIILNGDIPGAVFYVSFIAGVAALIAAPAVENAGKREKQPSARTLRIAAASVCAVVVISGLIASYVMSEPVGQPAGPVAVVHERVEVYDLWNKADESSFLQIGQIMRGLSFDGMGNNRFFTWRRVLILSREFPLLGVGPDNLKSIFSMRYMDDMHHTFTSSGGLDKAHNEFLDVLLCSGYPALILMLGFFFILFYKSYKSTARSLSCGVFASAAFAYFVHAIFGYQLPLHSPIMWTVVGLAAACCFEQGENKQERGI